MDNQYERDQRDMEREVRADKKKGLKLGVMQFKNPYDDLALMPNVIAQTVCGQPYTGHEQSDKIRNADNVKKTEALRQKMTPTQISVFVDLVDAICRRAYFNKLPWFMKCANSKTNAGRDQMYIWISHWLNSYLNDRFLFRNQVISGRIKLPD